jgi:hypothetical protein
LLSIGTLQLHAFESWMHVRELSCFFFYLCIWRQEQQLKPPWIESQIG